MIRTKHQTQAYRDGWERAFEKKKKAKKKKPVRLDSLLKRKINEQINKVYP